MSRGGSVGLVHTRCMELSLSGSEDEFEVRSRIISNHLKDRDNCIVLKIDTHNSTVKNLNPFGFHFELDKEKYQKRKKQLRKERFTRLFSLIAHYHHKYGVRHILLVALLIGYVCVGGAIFNSLEAPKELEDLRDSVEEMSEIMIEEVYEINNITATYNGTERDEHLLRLLRRFYKTMLEAEGKFHGSVWHKAENLELRLTWHFSSSCFYCMTLFTTIGYGSISPQTVWGRVITVIYACIGIPLMLVVLGDIGEWFQKFLTKGYLLLLMKYRKMRKLKDLTRDEIEDVFLPMWLALPLVASYVIACALFIRMFDHNEGQLPGIGFGEAFYFTFISLTTIGLGDLMPYNIQYSPILSSAFLLGLALVSIVNTSIYAQLYDVFYNSIRNMEENLDAIHKKKQIVGEGYKIFQDMEPSVRLLVCSFPHVGNNIREGVLEGILKTEGSSGKKEKKVTYSSVVRKRTISYTGDEKEEKSKGSTGRMRAPTLGAFGGRELAKFRKERQVTRRSSDATAPSVSIIQRRGSDAGNRDAPFDWKTPIKSKKAVSKPEPNEDKETEVITDEITKLSVTQTDETKTPTQDLSNYYDDEPSNVQGDTYTNDENVHECTDNKEESEEDVRKSSESSRNSSDDEGSDDEPPANRPAPLLEMPVLKPSSGDSDDSDDDSDDEPLPPTSKFANLKRGSYFVPRQQSDSDDDDNKPNVEYIP